MSVATPARQGFTGRHMLAVMLAFFGVIVSVNLLMASYAISSWSGLVVKNSYVASQQFNEKAQAGRAQAALGWTGRLTIGNGQVRYALADAAGHLLPLTGVKASFRHPAYESQDVAMVLSAAGGSAFAAGQAPADGIWIVEIEAQAGLDHPYRDVRRIRIAGGTLQ
jgi:nitrogen fixation protein FixH